MTNDTRKTSPVELSQLQEISDPSGFWIFGSRRNEDGVFESGRYEFDKLADYARKLQLERRISLAMETEDIEMFIGEEMTIYKIVAKNVKDLVINNSEIAEADYKELDIPMEEGSVMNIHLARSGVDPKAYLFIYAKAKMEYL